jgi:uncharacterized membrane protein YgcG
MRRFLLLAAFTALAFPAGASAKSLHGTVVHRITHAHSFVIAGGSGKLIAIHSARRPSVGRVVSVTARRLSNGTYSAKTVRQGSTRRHARLRGTVTHVNRRAGTFVLSARGTSLLVHRRARGARAADAGPSVGDTAIVNATLTDQGDIEADDVQTTGQDQTFDVEGLVQAVDTAKRTITVSADDEDQSGGSLVINLPTGVDPSQFTVGQEVELAVTRAADGTLTLATGSSDEEGGDDQGEHQGGGGGDQKSGGGDQKSGGDHQGSGDNGGGGGGGD